MVINGLEVDLAGLPGHEFQNLPTVAMGIATHSPTGTTDSYSSQGDALVAHCSEYEQRTHTRLAAREKSGRSLSDGDLKRWEDLKHAADRVLGVVAPEPSQSEAETIAIEIEKQRLVALSGGMA